jgi:hypothetical protein
MWRFCRRRTPDGKSIVFSRTGTGGLPDLWDSAPDWADEMTEGGHYEERVLPR